MRVMSRNPPAARRSSTACSSLPCVWPRPSASTPRAAARGSRPRPARRGARAPPRRLGAEPARPTPRTVGERLRVGAAGRREHPGRADEQVGARRRRGPPAPSPPSGGRRRTAPRASGRAASTAATTGAFTEPTSVTSAAPASSASSTTLGDVPDRHRDDREVGAGDRVGDVGGERRRPRPGLGGRGRAPASRSKPRTSTPARREREPDRAADQAGADERDGLRSGHCGRDVSRRRRGRRAAPSRPRGTRGAARRGPVGVAVHRAPGCSAACRAAMASSRAQSSGTSPRPRRRAPRVAGNSAVRSSVAVKMMLTRSSCSSSLRVEASPCTSALRLGVDLGLRVLVARGRAAQRQAVSSGEAG